MCYLVLSVKKKISLWKKIIENFFFSRLKTSTCSKVVVIMALMARKIAAIHLEVVSTFYWGRPLWNFCFLRRLKLDTLKWLPASLTPGILWLLQNENQKSDWPFFVCTIWSLGTKSVRGLWRLFDSCDWRFRGLLPGNCEELQNCVDILLHNKEFSNESYAC